MKRIVALEPSSSSVAQPPAAVKARTGFAASSCVADHCSHTHQETAMIANTHPFRLCFRSLFNSGRGYAFPCDALGHVDLDALTDRARNNYLFARAMVGRELAVPAV